MGPYSLSCGNAFQIGRGYQRKDCSINKLHQRVNPFTQLETSHPNNNDERLLANGYLEIKPWEWLTFKSSISMNRYSWQNRSYREKYHFSDYDTNVKNSVSAAMGRSTEMFYENTLTFAKKFAGKHDVSFMVGQTTTTIHSQATAPLFL